MPDKENKRINEIDLLRFAAALMVVFYHYAFRGYAADNLTVMPYPLRFAKYGYLGVNLFFIISGFVILMTAASGDLKKFLISRVVRLYPAFWISCTITFLAILAIGGERYSATFSQYAINLTMLSEFFSVPSIDGVYWSLFVEIKFYVLIAALLWFRKIDRAEIFFVCWLIVSGVLEFFYHNGYLYYWLAADYAAYFAAGAMFFLIWSKGVSISRIVTLGAAWTLAINRALKDVAYNEKHFKEPYNENLVIGIVTIFFLTMLLVALKRTGWVGRARWAFVGALTYPLYLLHHRFGFIIFNRAYPAFNPHLTFWGTLAFMLILSYAVSRLEQKISPSFKGFLNHRLQAG